MSTCLKGKSHVWRLVTEVGVDGVAVACWLCDEPGTLDDLDQDAADFHRMRDERDKLQAEVKLLKAELSDEGADEPRGIEIEVDPDYVPMPPRGVWTATPVRKEARCDSCRFVITCQERGVPAACQNGYCSEWKVKDND